jgi:hypothetical protein
MESMRHTPTTKTNRHTTPRGTRNEDEPGHECHGWPRGWRNSGERVTTGSCLQNGRQHGLSAVVDGRHEDREASAQQVVASTELLHSLSLETSNVSSRVHGE